MDFPIVYIILPCYNTEKYLLNQLLSIYNQQYEYWYLVFVNDWSTDNSDNIIRDFISNYNLHSKVTVITKENGGVNSAVNAWLEYLKTKNIDQSSLICFCDSDDIWTRDKLSLQVEYMMWHPECGLVFHDMSEIDENWKIRLKSILAWRYYSNNTFHKVALITHFLSTEMMFRSKYIDNIYSIPEWYHIWQDLWAALVLTLLKVNVYCINKPLWYHRVWHASLSRFASRNWLKWLMEERLCYLQIIHERYIDIDMSYEMWYFQDAISWENKWYSKIRIVFLIMLKYPKYFYYLIKESYAKNIRIRLVNWF